MNTVNGEASMFLTEAEVVLLRAPFPLDDYDLQPRPTKNSKGEVEKCIWLAYIDQEAVSTRLDMIELNWQFEIVTFYTTPQRVAAHGFLILKQLRRDGVGEEALNNAEPYKSAATDALKRAAYNFGVGAHLRQKVYIETPNSTKADKKVAEAKFAEWYKDTLLIQEKDAMVERLIRDGVFADRNAIGAAIKAQGLGELAARPDLLWQVERTLRQK